MIFKKNNQDESIDTQVDIEKDVDTISSEDKDLNILLVILSSCKRLLLTAKCQKIHTHLLKISEEIITALDGLYPDWVYPQIEQADKYTDEGMIDSLKELLSDIQDGRDEAKSMAVQCFLASAGIRTVQALRALYAKVDNKS